MRKQVCPSASLEYSSTGTGTKRTVFSGVKITLFVAYCQAFYTCQLWQQHTQRALNTLRVQYNNTFRALLGLPWRCSASGMFVAYRVDGFHAVLHKRHASFMERIRSTDNDILRAAYNVCKNAYSIDNMDVKYDHPMLHLSQKLVDTVREQCGVDKKRLKEDIQTVLDWCSKEEHLEAAVPYLAKTGAIERQLLLSKCSVEDCKKRIDALLTTRALMPEICLNRNVDEFGTICKTVRYVTLPKTNPLDLTRILVTQILENANDFTMLGYLRYAYHMGEYRLYHDYGIAERYILDMKHITLGLLTKLNPVLIRKSEILSTEAYGSKLKGIHILNAPPFVDKLIFILKQGMKPKVAARIMVHSTYEDLHQHIAKEILPKDFGGDEPTLEKLTESWNDIFNTEECKQKMKDLDRLVSDETKRSSAKFNEEYLGMPGTFRKLDVD